MGSALDVSSALPHLATFAFQHRFFWPSYGTLGNGLCSSTCDALQRMPSEHTVVNHEVLARMVGQRC